MLNLIDTAKLHHATKAKAEKLASMFENEYPALQLSADYNEDESQVVGWTVNHGDTLVIEKAPKVPELGDVLEACEDAGLNPEEGAEEEEERLSGSVVDPHYREVYRESSNKQTCGDWLAEWLVERTNGGKLDVDAFDAILSANGVPMNGKWATSKFGSRGWQGRYRMSGRIVLEKHVAKAGFVVDGAGHQHEVPEEALGALRQKHAKWLAKEAKLDEAAEQLAE